MDDTSARTLKQALSASSTSDLLFDELGPTGKPRLLNLDVVVDLIDEQPLHQFVDRERRGDATDPAALQAILVTERNLYRVSVNQVNTDVSVSRWPLDAIDHVAFSIRTDGMNSVDVEAGGASIFAWTAESRTKSAELKQLTASLLARCRTRG